MSARGSHRVTVCQLGARRHYAVPRGLAAAKVLESLVTDAYAALFPWNVTRFIPSRLQCGLWQRLAVRCSGELDTARVKALPVFCLVQAICRFQRRERETQADAWVRQNNRFGRACCPRIDRQSDAVYAFNGAALEIFREAKRRSMRCILDQTVAPWCFNRDLLTAEMETWSDWEEMPADLDSSGAMIEREREEWDLADRIVCGSQFVLDAMRQVDGPTHKCRVITYPTPSMPHSLDDVSHSDGSRTKVLFVGTLQLRKGIQYFAEAASLLDQNEYRFRAVGPSHLTPTAMSRLERTMDVVGPVSRSDVWRQYQWADVFVLPTLSEGSANVCHEARACGLPVITTAAAGLERGMPGVTLVPCRTSQPLAKAIVDTPRGRKPIAPRTRTVAEYGQELAEVIAELK